MLKIRDVYEIFSYIRVLKKLNIFAFGGLFVGEKSIFFRCIQSDAIGFYNNAFFLNYRFEILESFTITLGCYEKVCDFDFGDYPCNGYSFIAKEWKR
jgi:hypothetical protein